MPGPFGGSLRARGENLFAAPTAFRALRKEDPDAALRLKYDLSGFKRLMLAGERCDPPTLGGSRIGSGFLWWITGGRRNGQPDLRAACRARLGGGGVLRRAHAWLPPLRF